jgi:hypothetical protein
MFFPAVLRKKFLVDSPQNRNGGVERKRSEWLELNPTKMVVFDKLFNPTAQQNGGLQKTHQGIYEEEHCARLIATGLSQKKQAKRYGREASFFSPFFACLQNPISSDCGCDYLRDPKGGVGWVWKRKK